MMIDVNRHMWDLSCVCECLLAFVNELKEEEEVDDDEKDKHFLFDDIY